MSKPKADRIKRAVARLILDNPFFATITLNRPLVASDAFPTMATDHSTIYYNPDWCAGIAEPELAGVLAHEVMHIVGEHCLRRGARDPRLWNVACDYAINPLIVKAGIKLPAGALNSPRWQDNTPEQIYSELAQEGGKGGGQGNPGTGSQSWGAEDVQDAARPDGQDMSAAERESAKAELKGLGVEAVRYVATSATRDARNAEVFVEGVRTAFGERDVRPAA